MQILTVRQNLERENRQYLRAARNYAREARRHKFMRNDPAKAERFAYQAACAIALVQINNDLIGLC